MKLFSGLRSRVWLLVALVAGPLFVHSLLVYRDHRDQAMARVGEEFQQLIDSALVEETYLVNHTRELLRIMANSGDLKRLDADECSALAERLLQTQRDYLNFGAVLPDGNLFCSGALPSHKINFSDRAWFREAVERKDFSRGYYLVSRIAKKPGVVYAYPVFDGAGKLQAVVYANTGLGWMANLAFANKLPPGWEAAIVAPGGETVARQPSGAAGSGQLDQGGALSRLLQAHPPAGMHELVGADGQVYLYGIAPLRSSGDGLRILIGAPKNTVLAPVERNFRTHLALLLLLSIASILIGQRAMEYCFVRWAVRLHENIRRIGAGERKVPTQEPSAIRELAEIDAALLAMVDNINAGAAALKASQEHLGVALEGADLGAWDWHVPSGTQNCNERLARMLGYRLDELAVDAASWKQCACPEDLPTVEAALARHLEGLSSICECEFRLRHKDGRWLWVLARGRVVERDAAGQPVRLAGTALDITDRKETEQQLRQRTEELVALVEAMPALVLIARDPQCREVVGNRAANELYAVPAGANLSDCLAGLVPSARIRHFWPDGRECALDELPMRRAAMEARAVLGSEMQVRLPDGRNLWLFGNAVPLFDDQGGARGALGAFVDVTHFKATEEALRRHQSQLEARVDERTYELAVAKEAAERANRTKSQFLANVSHELRTPLNSLMLLAHVLSGNSWGNLTPQQMEYARMIELSGNDLLHLIDELQDLGRIEAGRLELHIKPVSFPDLMQGAHRTHRHVAKHKGLEFKMEIDADVPAAIVTDPLRLQQLLRNFLSNAIKFTHQGSVILRIRLAVAGTCYSNPALARAAEVIAFDIIDTGIGIESAQQQKISAAFQLHHAESDWESSGTGLGLAICREIATLLGGELGLVSVPGQGSTFTLYLPLVYAGPVAPAVVKAEPVPPPRPAAGGDAALAGKRVLVVDDDQRIRYALGVLLEKQGMQVLSMSSGAEAIELLAGDTAVDIVLMDVAMPFMDGYQTSRAIRQDLGLKHLPLIALTAGAMSGSREACLAAGFSDYQAKPASNAELLQRLRRWLQEKPVAIEAVEAL